LLPFEEPSFAVNFTDDLFVMIQEAQVTVWNVVQDSWVKWQIDMEAESVRPVIPSYSILFHWQHTFLRRHMTRSALNVMGI